MDLSFQLYSAREHGPWSEVFARLAALGYTGVEGYAALYEDPDALARELASNALAMHSGHVAVDVLENDADTAFGLARTLGIGTIYAPFLAAEARPDDVAGWRAFGARLARIGERVAAEGLGFGWHNHDFELASLADGSVPLDILFSEAPDMSWEADLAWVARAGAEPAEWVERLGARATAVHVKDIAPAGEAADEDGWADPGHGTLEWPALIDAMRAHGNVEHWIVEHDKPSDIERFASRAMQSWRGWTDDAGTGDGGTGDGGGASA